MANGDEDVEWEFDGNPACPLCGPLAGTTDSRPIPPPHENCQCTNVPRCNNQYAVPFGDTTHFGPGNKCVVFTAEIIVTCWDGTEIGATVPIDFGCEGADEDEGWWDLLWSAIADEAAALEAGCVDCLLVA